MGDLERAQPQSWLAPQRSTKGVPLAPSHLPQPLPRGPRRPRGHGPWLRHDPARRADAARAPAPRASSRRPTSCARWSASTAPTASTAATPRRRADARRRSGRIPTSGIALHPYLPRAGLRARPRARRGADQPALDDDAPARPARRAAAKLPRRLPVWLTEFGFQTDPPDPFQTADQKVPAHDGPERVDRLPQPPRALLLAVHAARRGPQARAAASSATPASRWACASRAAGRRRACTTRSACRSSCACLQRIVWRFSAGCGPEAGAVARIESRRRGGSYRPLGKARLSSAGYFRKVLSVSGVECTHLQDHDQWPLACQEARHALTAPEQAARREAQQSRDSPRRFRFGAACS